MERLRLVLFLATQSDTEEWLSRMSFPTMVGARMVMQSLRMRAPVSKVMSSVPSVDVPETPRINESIRGVVKTPTMLVVTVIISARALFPPACVARVTPDVRVVGTQQKTVNPIANAGSEKGICRAR